MKCNNCSINITRNMHIHRNFDISVLNEKGERVKSTVNLIACSSKCLHEQASEYNLWVNKELENQRSYHTFNGGAGF